MKPICQFLTLLAILFLVSTEENYSKTANNHTFYPYISELMADNKSFFGEINPPYPDWIELHNPSDSTIDLSGYFFTDDSSDYTKWLCPDIQIPAEGYQIFFASGKDFVAPEQIHTSFKLNREGEYLAIIAPDSQTVISSISPGFPPLGPDESFGFINGRACIFTSPTPGHPNIDSSIVLNPPQFNVSGGFLDEPNALSMQSEEGDSILYTLDGTRPSEENGSTYTEPIILERNTIVRAVAVKSGSQTSAVSTRTFLFADSVTGQWAMDETLLNEYGYHTSIEEALNSLPTVSLVMEPKDIWDKGTGIHYNPMETGRDWERPVSVEFYSPEGNQSFQIDSGIRIHGQASRLPWNSLKHSFRLYFRSEYGPSKLEYPLFDDTDVHSFDRLILRAGFNDTWIPRDSESRIHAQYIRDTFVRQLQKDMGYLSPHSRFVHLYINSNYRGVYEICERIDESFLTSYKGGEENQWEIIKDDILIEEVPPVWSNLMASTRYGQIEDIRRYQNLCNRIDIINFIDFILINLYIGNLDWIKYNWYGACNLDNGNKYTFFCWDSEMCMRDINENQINSVYVNRPMELFHNLLQSSEFKTLLGDRIHKHFSSGGVLAAENTLMQWRNISEKITPAIVAESVRWGAYRYHNHHDPNYEYTGPFELYTYDDHWQTENQRILNDYLPRRTNITFRQLRRSHLYPSQPAPEIQELDSLIQYEKRFTFNGSQDTVYYTLNGSDPRLAGGAINPSARLDSSAFFTLSINTIIKARSRQNGNWSALVEKKVIVDSGIPPAAGDLIISEINYKPVQADSAESARGYNAKDFEFLELKNVSDRFLDLSQLSFIEGIRFNFTEHSTRLLPPHQYCVLARNSQAFPLRYSTIPSYFYGDFDGSLSNEGETLLLTDQDGNKIIEIAFDVTDEWPSRVHGAGSTLVPVDTNFSDSQAESWRASVEYHGSPGVAALTADSPVVINEILIHSEDSNQDGIELYNTTANALSISGWLLYNPSMNKSGRIAEDQIIEGNQYCVLLFNQMNQNPDSLFSSQKCTELHLIETHPSGQWKSFIDVVEVWPARLNESSGRWPDITGGFFPMQEQTLFDEDGNPLGRVNSLPRIGPVTFTEIMYHPASNHSMDEYIVITNGSDNSVDIGGWKIRGGIEYTFPDSTRLWAGQALLVVPFDFTDSSIMDAFRTVFPLPEYINITGGWKGKLDNLGEPIGLIELNNDSSYAFIDQLHYMQNDSWPQNTNGTGYSLLKENVNSLSSDASNWKCCTNPLYIFSDIKKESGPIPVDFKLYQNCPNPFNGNTRITYELPRQSYITIDIINIRGQKVIELDNGMKRSGSHTVHWNGKNSAGQTLGSGIYYAILHNQKKRIATKKMLFIK